MARAKVEMVDNEKVVDNTEIEVVLNETSPNELIGGHTVYMPFGTFEFDNGKAKVTKKVAEQLKSVGVIK